MKISQSLWKSKSHELGERTTTQEKRTKVGGGFTQPRHKKNARDGERDYQRNTVLVLKKKGKNGEEGGKKDKAARCLLKMRWGSKRELKKGINYFSISYQEVLEMMLRGGG